MLPRAIVQSSQKVKPILRNTKRRMAEGGVAHDLDKNSEKGN